MICFTPESSIHEDLEARERVPPKGASYSFSMFGGLTVDGREVDAGCWSDISARARKWELE